MFEILLVSFLFNYMRKNNIENTNIRNHKILLIPAERNQPTHQFSYQPPGLLSPGLLFTGNNGLHTTTAFSTTNGAYLTPTVES